MENFPKFLASRLAQQQRAGDVHPAADLLTAFVEQRLGKKDRRAVFAHLASCAECRGIVALVSEAESAQAIRQSSRWNWWHLRWVTGLAATCVVAVLMWRPGTVQPVVENKPIVSLPIAPQATPAVAAAPAAPKTMVPLAKPKSKAFVAPQVTAAASPPPSLPAPPALPQQVQTDTISGNLPAAPPPQPHVQSMFSRAVAPTIAPRMAKLKAIERPLSLWSIEANVGSLRKSDDGGSTWVPIKVDGRSTFLSLSVSDEDVWAGGRDGALFHSIDGGAHWKSVTPTDGVESLKSDITHIDARGLAVTLKTTSGTWVTSDGGDSWHKTN